LHVTKTMWAAGLPAERTCAVRPRVDRALEIRPGQLLGRRVAVRARLGLGCEPLLRRLDHLGLAVALVGPGLRLAQLPRSPPPCDAGKQKIEQTHGWPIWPQPWPRSTKNEQ